MTAIDDKRTAPFPTLARADRSPAPHRLTLRRAQPYLLIAPAVLVLSATLGYPIAQMVALSFQRENLSDLLQRSTTWVGLTNYKSVLSDPFFWTVVLRTAGFATTCLIATLAIGTGLAILLQRSGRIARGTLSA